MIPAGALFIESSYIRAVARSSIGQQRKYVRFYWKYTHLEVNMKTIVTLKTKTFRINKNKLRIAPMK
jgi:hypothetical protein